MTSRNDLLCAGEAVPAGTLPGRCIAGRTVPAAAPLQAAFTEGSRGAGVLAVLPDKPRRTLTRPLHGVAQSAVLALTLLEAAGAPLLVATGWRETHKAAFGSLKQTQNDISAAGRCI